MVDEAAEAAAAAEGSTQGPDVPAHPLVVAIGSSAGGLQALTRFFGALPAESGLRLLLAQHVLPGDEPLLAETLSRLTGRKVVVAADGMALQADHILVIPPGSRAGFRAGRLRLRRTAQLTTEERVDPVDRLFRSVADAFGPLAVGVVLSGTGTDGALGLQAVGGAGGLAMAQDSASAAHAEMPDAAAASGFADHVGPPEALAAALMEHDRHRAARLSSAGDAARRRLAAVARLPEVCAVLRDRTGHDFRHYKATTLVRRLERRMRVLRLDSIDAYLERLQADVQEPTTLFRELLVGVTAFFRDPDAFQVLSERAIAPLLAGRAPGDPLRIWVAGCATGEEAYSVAMVVREVMDALPEPVPVQVFATDVNDRALATARRGVYLGSIAGSVSPERLARFFVRRGRHWQVGEELRAMCLFSPHNVISDPPFSRLDLICCRNLLIYLGAHLQKKLIPLFHYALKRDGYLFLGASETLAGHAELFRPVDARQRLAQRKTARGVLPAGRAEPRPVAPARDVPSQVALREAIGSHAPLPEAELGAVAQRIILDEFALAYAIVSAEGNIIYLSERADRFLQPPAGSFTASITRMARRGLGVGLRAALSEAVRTRRTTVRDGMSMQTPDGVSPVRLAAQPMPEMGHGDGLYMLVFQEAAPVAAARGVGGTLRPDAEAVIGQLERELVSTRGDLERAVQDLEAANEELKASNEELLSMNEELQSSNEELETSKEEVQAANAALAASNADLENLLRATRIATVFLDREGCVRSFTPAAADIYPIGPQDLGRPLAHLTHRLQHLPPLPEPEALRDLTMPVEHEAEDEDGRWFLRRVLPYRGPGDGADGLVVTFLDITGRKRDERALREAEERLHLAQQAGRVGAWEWETDTDRAHWSDGMRPLLGLPPDAPPAASAFLARVLPEDRAALDAAIADVLSGRSSHFHAEFRIRRADDGEVRWLAGRGEIERDGPARLRGINIDVTERRAAEAALRESEARYRVLTEAAAHMTWVMRPDSSLSFVSRRWREFTGLSVEHPTLEQRLHLVHPDDRDVAEQAVRSALAEARGFEARFRMCRHDGQWRWVLARGEPLPGPDGHPVEWIGTIMDVHEAEQAQAALRAVGEASPAPLFLKDAQGRYLFANPATDHALGAPPGGVVGRTDADFLPPAAAAQLRRNDLQVMAAGVSEAVEETLPKGESTERGLYLVAKAPWRDPGTGAVAGVVGVAQDITERKAIEAALVESDARFREIASAVDDVFWIAEPETRRVLYVSPAYERVWGRKPPPVPFSPADMLHLVHPEDRDRLREALYATDLAEGYAMEFRVVHPDGRVRWVQDRGRLVATPPGAPRRIAGLASDVTERREAERRLSEREALLRAVLDNVPVAVVVAEAPSGRLLFGNPGVERVFRHSMRLSPDAEGYREWEAYHADGRRVESHEYPLARVLSTGEPAQGEYHYACGDGVRRWISITGAPIKDASGRLVGAAVVCADVDDRRRAAAFLEENEARLRLITEATGLGTFDWDLVTGTVRCSDAYFRVYGIEPQADGPDYEAWLARVHPEDRAAAGEAARQGLGTGQYLDRYRIVRPDATVRWVAARGVVLRDAAGSPVRFLGINVDVTEREQAAAALVESEARFRQIAGALDDVFWIAEADPLRMIYTSPAHQQVWGWPAAASGPDLETRLAAIHPEDRDRMRRALTETAPREGIDEEFRIRRPDGEERWLRDRVLPVPGSGAGGPARVAGLTRDVTVRRRAEEIRRLMVHELDHRVKNTLAVVQSLAQQTQRATADHPERFFADFAPRIRALAGAHDLLTQGGWRGAQLSEVLDRTVAAHAVAAEGGLARLSAEGPAVTLAPAAAVSLSMVFHELATNSAKYGALSAPGGRIALAWSVEPEALVLRWTERGGPTPKESTRRGFGSRLLQGVVVRELGGELQQQLAPEGLECRIRLPLSSRVLAAG